MYWCNHFIRPIPQPFIKYLRDIRNRKWGRVTMLELTNYAMLIACVASVSVRFRSKERGTMVKDCAKNGVSKRAGRGGEERKETLPLPLPPPFHFLARVSFLARFKPRILFLGLSLLRNQTETLATQATMLRKPMPFLVQRKHCFRIWRMPSMRSRFLRL